MVNNLGNYGGSQGSVTALNNNGQALINVFSGFVDNHALLLSSSGSIEGTISTGTTTDNAAMNDRGQVVGTKSTNNGQDWYPFLWDSGTFTQLAPSFDDPSGVNFGPYAINNSDEIVGNAGGLVGPHYAALWLKGQIY